MKTYTVTLAQLAWIKGTVDVAAESFDEAFAIAKSDDVSPRASWPVGDDGDTVVGFGPVEIDAAYCAEEAETDHDGEAPAADVMVYLAAPELLEACQRLLEELRLIRMKDTGAVYDVTCRMHAEAAVAKAGAA